MPLVIIASCHRAPPHRHVKGKSESPMHSSAFVEDVVPILRAFAVFAIRVLKTWQVNNTTELALLAKAKGLREELPPTPDASNLSCNVSELDSTPSSDSETLLVQS